MLCNLGTFCLINGSLFQSYCFIFGFSSLIFIIKFSNFIRFFAGNILIFLFFKKWTSKTINFVIGRTNKFSGISRYAILNKTLS